MNGEGLKFTELTPMARLRAVEDYESNLRGMGFVASAANRQIQLDDFSAAGAHWRFARGGQLLPEVAN